MSLVFLMLLPAKIPWLLFLHIHDDSMESDHHRGGWGRMARLLYQSRPVHLRWQWHNVMEIFKLLISGSFEVSNHGIRFVILVRMTVANWMFLRKWSAETWQPWFGLTGSCTSYFGSVAWCTFEDAGPFQGWTSEWWTWSSWMIFFWTMNFPLNR